MKIQLHSIHHAPANLPFWPTLMDDLCNPPPDQVARVLGKSPRTIHRYNATGCAPRVVCLAVFWLTRWGRSAVHAQAHNDAVTMAGLANSLRSERDAFQGEARRLRTKCDRLKIAIHRLRGELQAELGRQKRLSRAWSQAQLERSERGRIWGSAFQFETEWKVLLEPSPQTPALAAPDQLDAEPASQVEPATPPKAPLHGRYSMGRRYSMDTAGDDAAFAAASLAVPARAAAGADAGSSAFGWMLGALAHRPTSWPGGHESDAVDVRPAVPVSEGSEARESLPLADLVNARAGTPPSATAPSAWKAPRRLDSLKTQPRRRASAK